MWDGVNWDGGTDIGYLSLLFFGGVPLMVTYTHVHVVPAGLIVSRTVNEWQLPAAGVVSLWGLRMLSSEYPSLTLEYYPVLLCLGACIARYPRKQS